MKLIHPSFSILDDLNADKIYKRIEAAGRTCYKSEDKITADSAEKFVRMIIKRGHESVLEHVSIGVRVICDRGVSHEIVRHRIASYSQESTRYCDYDNGHITFIIPPWVKITPSEYINLTSDEMDNLPNSIYYWLIAMSESEAYYKALRAAGWKPEEARSVLPNSLKTEIVMTMNLREWKHFFKLRTSPAAHPQMREIAIPLQQEFAHMLPAIFNPTTEELKNDLHNT